MALRHQVMVLRRQMRGRVHLTNLDRLLLVQLYRWCPSILQIFSIVQPETLVRWNRAGFRGYWRWKSRARGGRPKIETDLRALIRRMSIENPLWGAPRIHGELLKLGLEVAQSSVAKYMVKRQGPRGPGMGYFSAQPCPRHRREGLVRRPDPWLRSALCLGDRPARPQRTCLGQRDS